MRRQRLAVSISIAAVSMLVAGALHAQADYPNRPIRYIVPYPAGGSTSYIARLVGQRYTDVWGQQVIIDNRPGGDTIIGTQVLARARPDGYTLGFIGINTTVNQTLHQTPYDALRDFAHVATIAAVENLLVVHPSLAATTPQEFVALARSRPGQLTFATSSAGGSTHLAAEMLNGVAGIKTRQIPYKGGGPAIADLMGGQVNFMMAVPTNVMAQVKAGRLRAIAVSGESRLSALPNIPTFSEAGVAGVSLKTWHGISSPAGTPKAIIAKLASEVARLVALPESKEKLDGQGFVTFYNDPDRTTALIRSDIARFAKLIKEANIRAE